MRKKKSLSQVIEFVTRKYLGKMGIIGITNDSDKIILYSNLNKMDYNKIPHILFGYNVYIKPSEKFSVQV